MVDYKKNKNSKTIKRISIILKTIREYKSKMDFAAVIAGLILVILHLKPIIKYRLCGFLKNEFDISFESANNLFLFFEYAICIIIFLCVVLSIAVFLSGIWWSFYIKKLKGDSRFEQCALRYMRDKGIPHCLLITGEWGSGKTYEVNDFLQKYYYNSNIKIYRISCFGLCTRKEVIEEINDTIEREDNSLYKTICIVVRYIPVLGELISKLVRRTYRYDSVKEKSIFVFDDFERITSRTTEETGLPGLYKRDSLLKTNLSRANSPGSDIIDNEFKQVERAFSRLITEKQYITDRNDYDKYISIAGLINELIETKKAKVLIICNSDVVGEKFIHDVLRSKLNCIEYKKVPSPVIRESVVKRIINNTIFEELSKQKLITDYSIKILQKWKDSAFEPYLCNLRLFGGLFEAFINEIVSLDIEYLTIEFLDSLFKSIFVTHILYYENNLSILDRFENGMNLAFLLRLYANGRRYYDIAEECIEDKWVDVAISGHWILNLSRPNNMNGILKQWKEYEFGELERNLNTDYRYIENAEKCNLLHVFYIMNVNDNSIKWDYQTAINKALREYDISEISVIQDILDLTNEVLRTFNKDFYNELIQSLLKGGAVGEIVGNGYVYQRYRSCIKNNDEA